MASCSNSVKTSVTAVPPSSCCRTCLISSYGRGTTLSCSTSSVLHNECTISANQSFLTVKSANHPIGVDVHNDDLLAHNNNGAWSQQHSTHERYILGTAGTMDICCAACKYGPDH